MNVHPDCQDQAPRCQPKGRMLLRRQRSESEINAAQAAHNRANVGPAASVAGQFAHVAEDDNEHSEYLHIQYSVRAHLDYLTQSYDIGHMTI